MTIKIRQAVSGDEKELAKLNSYVHEYHLEMSPSIFKHTDISDVEKWFSEKIEKPKVRAWIAEKGGISVGYIIIILYDRSSNTFCLPRRWIEIDQIGVHPKYRSSGIGRRLIEKTFEFALKQKIDDIELLSFSYNVAAHEAFKKYGFEPRIIRFGQKVIRES